MNYQIYLLSLRLFLQNFDLEIDEISPMDIQSRTALKMSAFFTE